LNLYKIMAIAEGEGYTYLRMTKYIRLVPNKDISSPENVNGYFMRNMGRSKTI
jgi:hypothetical protein